MSQSRIFWGDIIKSVLWIILGFGSIVPPSNKEYDSNVPLQILCQINSIYALLSRIHHCRDYTLFGGHFWPTFGGGGRKNILVDQGSMLPKWMNFRKSSKGGERHFHVADFGPLNKAFWA